MSSHSTTNRLAAVLAYCDALEREQQRRREERQRQDQLAREQRQQEKNRQREIAKELRLRKKARPKPSRKQDHVYIIRASNGYYKIGISFNPQERFKDLQRDAAIWAVELELIYVIASKSAYSLEQAFHRRFVNQRATGEWFVLTDSDVEWLRSYGG